MRKKILIIAVGAILSVGAAGIQVLTQQPPAPPLKIEKVKEGLFVVSESGGNVGVRVTNDGLIVIDDKFERNFDEIMKNIRTVSDKPVKYVINTHQHGDHTGGNAKMAQTAEIIAHRNVRANMVKNNQADMPPRITFSNETAVHLGGVEVQAHHYGRGHTNGDAVIFFPDLQTVHMGDLFTNGMPFVDYANGGSTEEWVKTIDGALKLNFQTAIPGHGPIMTKADLQKHRDKIATMRTRATELVRKGVKKEDLKAQLKLDDLGWQIAGNAERSLPMFYDEIAAGIKK